MSKIEAIKENVPPLGDVVNAGDVTNEDIKTNVADVKTDPVEYSRTVDLPYKVTKRKERESFAESGCNKLPKSSRKKSKSKKKKLK